MARSRFLSLDQVQQFTAIKITSDPGGLGGPVQVPQCAQITLDWTLDGGKIAHNVLYGRYSGGFTATQTTASQIFAALNSGAAWTEMATHLSVDTSFSGVSIRDVNTPNQALVTSLGAAVAGTAPAAALPNEVALVVTLRTAQTGRSNRGRMFIPGWAAGETQNGNIASAFVVSTLGTWAASIASALSGAGFTWVIGQRERAAYTGSTGTQHPARAANSVPITSTVVRDNHWDSQRRRGLK